MTKTKVTLSVPACANFDALIESGLVNVLERNEDGFPIKMELTEKGHKEIGLPMTEEE